MFVCDHCKSFETYFITYPNCNKNMCYRCLFQNIYNKNELQVMCLYCKYNLTLQFLKIYQKIYDITCPNPYCQ